MTTLDANFKFTHTKGDSFDFIIPITKNEVAINWANEGYVSGICKVKKDPTQTTADITLIVDISVNGALRLYASAVIDNPVREYFYDIQFTKTGSKIETWWNDKMSKFLITQDIS